MGTPRVQDVSIVFGFGQHMALDGRFRAASRVTFLPIFFQSDTFPLSPDPDTLVLMLDLPPAGDSGDAAGAGYTYMHAHLYMFIYIYIYIYKYNMYIDTYL